MEVRNKIPIKNIYYMLSYAWESLKEKKTIKVSNEDFHNIYNLFGRIYINGLTALLKKGFNQYYIENNEDIYGIKGKLNLADSIKSMVLFEGKTNCDFDEFSKDMVLNQILKATINLLLKAPQLDLSYKRKLIKLKVYFQDCRDISLSSDSFSQLRFNKNNYHYKLLINISELLYRNTIPNEKEGNYLFRDFLRDRELSDLFEKFILNFYKTHLPEKRYNVYSPWIYWQADEINIAEDNILPVMKTDIVIEDNQKREQLIIDTKFYSKTLSEGPYKTGLRAHSGNIYQIFSYVQNSEYDGGIRGMLLYPQIDQELDKKYSILGKSIELRTINLNGDWNSIEHRLLNLIYEDLSPQGYN